jgi:hypothetical protein
MTKKFEFLETLVTILWAAFNALSTAYLALYVEGGDFKKVALMTLIGAISLIPCVYLKYIIYLCETHEKRHGAHEIRE